jgi:hypothetical protein
MSIPPAYLDHVSAAVVGPPAGPVPRIPAWVLTAYLNASSGDQDIALEQASLDIDNAMPYQGRLFDPNQVNQFPRIAYESAGRVRPFGWDWVAVPPGYGDVIWSWNETALAAYVPWDVLKAVVFQADSVLLGDREERLGEQHDGVSDTGVGGVRESYRDRNQNKGLDTGLCRRAYQLMIQYRARAGRIL